MVGVWPSSSPPVIKGTVWGNVKRQGPRKGQTSFPRRTGLGAWGALAGAEQGGPWLPGLRMGQDVALLFPANHPPPTGSGQCQTRKGKLLELPTRMGAGCEAGVLALHQRRTGAQGAGEGAERLSPHSLIHSFIHLFIPKYLWVPRPGQDSSDHRDSTAVNTNRVSLSDATIAPDRSSFYHRERAAGPDPHHDHPLYRTRLQPGEADRARGGRWSPQAQLDLLS